MSPRQGSAGDQHRRNQIFQRAYLLHKTTTRAALGTEVPSIHLTSYSSAVVDVSRLLLVILSADNALEFLPLNAGRPDMQDADCRRTALSERVETAVLSIETNAVAGTTRWVRPMIYPNLRYRETHIIAFSCRRGCTSHTRQQVRGGVMTLCPPNHLPAVIPLNTIIAILEIARSPVS